MENQKSLIQCAAVPNILHKTQQLMANKSKQSCIFIHYLKLYYFQMGCTTWPLLTAWAIRPFVIWPRREAAGRWWRASMRTAFMEGALWGIAGRASRATMLTCQMETGTGPTETCLEQQRVPPRMILRCTGTDVLHAKVDAKEWSTHEHIKYFMVVILWCGQIILSFHKS